jgi:predicted GNAT family N-acyltransferase
MELEMEAGPPRLVEFAPGDPLYAVAVSLRDAVLRKPLGLVFPIGMEEVERDYRHFGLVRSGAELSMLACLMVVPREGALQIRQMAVEGSAQRGGHGTALMCGVEQILREGGFRGRMYLHARATAVPFYERLGYAVLGAPFEEVGIPHRLMEKTV